MVKACPSCDETAFETWRFELLRCEKCQLVVDQAVWRPAANVQMEEAFFGEDYKPVQSFWVRLFEARTNRRTRMRLRRYTQAPGTLLEVGVGSGSFLSCAQTHGFAPVGCDLSPAICRRVERSTKIKMHCSSLEALPSQQQFDVIVMNHVLEHVSDPQSMLRAALARLKAGGVLHLAVPNLAAYEARLPGWNSYGPYHLLYFTPRTLSAVAEKAGFEILEVNTHESFSGWFLAILRTLTKRGESPHAFRQASTRAKRSTSILEHCYRVSMVAWGLATFPLRKFQGLLGKGDEVILLARIRDNAR